jgi:hypothetical protein
VELQAEVLKDPEVAEAKSLDAQILQDKLPEAD